MIKVFASVNLSASLACFSAGLLELQVGTTLAVFETALEAVRT